MAALRSAGDTDASRCPAASWSLTGDVGRGYAAEARRSLLPSARTLDEALAIVSPFLDPLLDSTAAGRWDPRHGEWDVSSVE